MDNEKFADIDHRSLIQALKWLDAVKNGKTEKWIYEYSKSGIRTLYYKPGLTLSDFKVEKMEDE